MELTSGIENYYGCQDWSYGEFLIAADIGMVEDVDTFALGIEFQN